ncbi:MAG: adenylosuccinate lyase, partial [Bacteroidales bacterium]|nr:adenylosuccinate lyase [Bacteroidales bacterium]
MELSGLTSLSPVDGRYQDRTEALRTFFSEYGLIKYRVKTEVEYFISLSGLNLKGLGRIGKDSKNSIRKIFSEFTPEDAERVKAIE